MLKYTKFGFMALVLIGFLAGLLPNPVSAKEIAWQSFDDGMARARSENKKIFLHFYARWCGACRIMDSKTFRDPAVIACLNENFIPIRVDVDRERNTSDLFRVRALPDNWFIAEDGNPIGHRTGYIAPDQLKIIMKRLTNEKAGQ